MLGGRTVEIGENIKRLRIDKGWKQKDLAEHSDVARVSVGNYERGTRIPPVDIAFRLAKSLGVNVGELVGETEETETESTIEQSDIVDGSVSSINVGNGLKKLRKEKGMTQTELGERTDMAQAYIGAIERGLRNPTTKTLEKILSKLDTTYIDFLVDYCGIKKETEPQSPLEQNFNKLTPENQKQVSDFIEFLISRQ